MISYHAKPLAVGPLLVLDALGKLTLKYNVQGSWRHDLVRFPFMFLRILQLFQFPGYLHIVNRSCASSQIEMCVHQSKSIRSIPHHFLLLYYKVDSQHTGTNIIQSLKKTSVCVCVFVYFLTPLDFWRMQTKRLPQKGSLWRTSRNFEKPHTIGTSCYAGPIEISSRTPSTWIRLSPLTFWQKTRKTFHNMRWIFPQINMLAHHVHVESVKDPLSPSFIILAVNCIRVAILFSSRITIM